MTPETPSQVPVCRDAGGTVPETIAVLDREGERELARDLTATFRSDAAARLARVRNALAGSDCATVAAQSHSIKGAALQLGAAEVASLAAALERSARFGEKLDYPRLIEELSAALAEACDAADRLLS